MLYHPLLLHSSNNNSRSDSLILGKVLNALGRVIPLIPEIFEGFFTN